MYCTSPLFYVSVEKLVSVVDICFFYLEKCHSLLSKTTSVSCCKKRSNLLTNPVSTLLFLGLGFEVLNGCSNADTPVVLSRACYTFTPRTPLVAVSGARQFHVSHACLLMPARSRSSLGLIISHLSPANPLTTSFIVIDGIVTDSMNTTHYSRRTCLSGGRKLSLEQLSAARRHISSDSLFS